MYDFVILGTRGQRPRCGEAYVRYGGHTTCFSLRTPSGLLLVDAGTGALEAHAIADVPSVTLLFTHFHLDHLLGLPVLPSLCRRDASLRLLADPRRRPDWKQALQAFVDAPFWPVPLARLHPGLRLEDLPISADRLEVDGVRVTWMRVPHPQQCLAFRLEAPGLSVVIATDLEYAPDAVADDFVAFCRRADVLVMDAEFTPEEYERHRGWGHSPWLSATIAASRANVSRLVLAHHAPMRTDERMDLLLDAARREFPNTDAGCDQMNVCAGTPVPGEREPGGGQRSRGAP